MIPGAEGAIDEDSIDEREIAREEAMILSMTLDERENHRIIGASRRKRIAAGSGTSVFRVNQLLKKFDKMRLTMKKATKKQEISGKTDVAAREAIGGIMSAKIRLKRYGTKKRPFFRIVVVDSRKPRDGRTIEELGFYHPIEVDGKQFKVRADRVKAWLDQGVKPTDTVRRLLNKNKFLDEG